MNILSYLRPENQISDLLGGSTNEILTKIMVGVITILWSVANDTAYLLFVFLLLLIVDAFMGVLLNKKRNRDLPDEKKRPFNGFYLFAGPGFKLIITSAVMVAMAILDNVIRSTPIGHIVTQPLTVGVGGAVCFAMGLDVVTKYAELSGNKWIVAKVRGWFGRMVPENHDEGK